MHCNITQKSFYQWHPLWVHGLYTGAHHQEAEKDQLIMANETNGKQVQMFHNNGVRPLGIMHQQCGILGYFLDKTVKLCHVFITEFPRDCFTMGIPSSGSSGRVRGGGGPRNMKSMRPPSAAIFCMTYFHRAGEGAMEPSAPLLDPLLIPEFYLLMPNNYGRTRFIIVCVTFYCDIRGVLQSYLDMSQTIKRFVLCEDDTFFSNQSSIRVFIRRWSTF